MLFELHMPILIFATLSAAMMAGIYFIFSTTIMQSLAEMADLRGMEAMQNINRVIINPFFFLLFFGSAGSSLMLLILYATNQITNDSLSLPIGAVALLISFLTTMLFNVPLNNRLKGIDMEKQDHGREWLRYLNKWTKWNLLRSLSSFISSISYLTFITMG